MAFESVAVPEDWRSTVIVLPYKGKGEMTECKNYRGISLLTTVRKIYRVRRVTEGLIDNERGSFTAGKGYMR